MPNTTLPGRVDLRVKEKTSIELPTAGVSGYVWQTESQGHAGVAEVTLVREDAEPGSSLVGKAVPQVLTIRGEAPGTMTVKLAQRRSWEGDAAPAQSHTVVVTVS